MTARYATFAIKGIFGALVSLMTCQQAFATNCDTLAVPGEKPAMNAYADYSDFLVAIMNFKALSRERAAQESACPDLLTAQIDAETLDPTVTYGPETLDSAAERASKLDPSIYQVGPKWHDRSTSRSFPLPALASVQMDHESISSHIRTLVDGPVSARDQQLAIDTLGPLADDDGAWGPEIADRQLHDELNKQEREASAVAARSDLPFEGIQTVYTGAGSYMRLYFDRAGQITRIYSLTHSCLGDCAPHTH